MLLGMARPLDPITGRGEFVLVIVAELDDPPWLNQRYGWRMIYTGVVLTLIVNPRLILPVSQLIHHIGKARPINALTLLSLLAEPEQRPAAQD